MPIVLYQLPGSGPCRAVMMTAHHLGIELVQKHVDLFSGAHMKPEFLAMNPKHCVPTIDDDGYYLWESRAIMTYLINKYAPDSALYPKDPKERAEVDKMLYFDIGTLYKSMLDNIFYVVFLGHPSDPEKEEYFQKALEMFDTILGKTTYAAGNHLTLADISLFASLTYGVQIGGYSLESYPKISGWFEKLKKEIPNHKEINEVPLQEYAEFLKERFPMKNEEK